MKADGTWKLASDPAPVDDAVGAALEEIHRKFGGDLASFFEALRERQAEEEKKREQEVLETQYPPVALSRLVRER